MKAPTAARQAGRTLSSGRLSASDRRALVAAANVELDAVGARLEAASRQRHPALFDRHGRLRRRALTQILTEQAGTREFTKADVIALAERSGRA